MVTLAGAVSASYGVVSLALITAAPGDPFPVLQVAAILLGAALFALGSDDGGAAPEGGRLGRTDAPEGRARFEPWAGGIPGAARRRLAGALALAVGVAVLYGTRGYHPLLLLGWVASWLLATHALWPFRRRPEPGARLTAGELGFLGALVVAASLLFFPYLDALPYEISTDEIYFTGSVRAFAEGAERNPLGLAPWWSLPSLHFASVSWLAPAIGTSIEAMRLVSGLTALLILAPFYLWIRALHGRTVATVATVLLPFAHAFIPWGRVALHQNAPVLLLAVAIALLTTGMRDRCPVKVLWGGIALGLGFYTYPSGQILIVMWLLVLAALYLARAAPGRAVLPVAALSLLGFTLVIGPMVANALIDFGRFTERAEAIAITNPAVLERLGELWGLDAAGDVVRENLKRGLLAFNGRYPYVTYFNPDHPLLDPATGTLLWLGLGLAAVCLRHPGLLLAVIGFLAVYLPNLLTEGAPVHGRLLLALPLVAVLSAEALVRFVRVVIPARIRSRESWLRGAALVAIVLLNLHIFHEFARHQMTTGRNDAVTAIGRTLGGGIELEGPLKRFFGQGKTWPPRHHVFFVSEEEAPIFLWAGPHDWHAWISFFSDSALVHEVPDVDAFLAPDTGPSSLFFWDRLTLFLPTRVWERNAARLLERHPHLERTTITPNRRLTAIEIQR